MKYGQSLIHIPTGHGEGYTIRVYESRPTFSHREYFAHKHSAFELSYVKSGRGLYRIEGEECPIRAGDMFVFGTNEVHCITDIEAGEPLVLMNIQFEPRLIWSPNGNMQNYACIAVFTHRAAGAGSRLNAENPATPRVIRLLLDIFRETEEKGRAYEMMVYAYLQQILAELVRGMDAGEAHTGLFVGCSRLLSMERAMNYIGEHLSERLTLEEIAEEAGLSRTYFSTLFRQLNGLSPWDYILIRRVETAKQLLAVTDEPVLEVCHDCGFDNVSHFNRVFRRIAGLTPRDYRNARKSDIIFR